MLYSPRITIKHSFEMFLIVLKALLTLIDLSLVVVLIIAIGVRFNWWELNIKYEKDKE